MKKIFREESPTSRIPSLAASFYIEFPTGDVNQQLGSGLRDYWLNLITQKSLSSKTRITGNLGYLFAGDTTNGAWDQMPKVMCSLGGISLQRDFLLSLTLGAEVFGAYSPNEKLGKPNFKPWRSVTTPLAKGFVSASAYSEANTWQALASVHRSGLPWIFRASMIREVLRSCRLS
jgi:hypothetical protein